MPIPPDLVGLRLGDAFVECHPDCGQMEHYLSQSSYYYFLAHEADEWTYGWMEKNGSRTSPREPGQPFAMKQENK